MQSNFKTSKQQAADPHATAIAVLGWLADDPDMPGAFAKKLYGMTEPGIPVIISDGEVVPQPIDHPTLFHPQAPAPMLLLSDVELRPSMPDSPGTPVQVAMNDTAAMPMPAAPPVAAPEAERPSEPISMPQHICQHPAERRTGYARHCNAQ